MTTSASTKKDLSQRAFDIYDHEGEEAMLSFIVDNEKRDRTAVDPQPRYHALSDGTAVEHLGDQTTSVYLAHWGRYNGQTRPASINPSSQPRTIDFQAPLLERPNAKNIVNAIMDQVESIAREQVGLIHDGDLITTYDVINVAPGLQHALTAAINLENQKPHGHRLSDYLDTIVTNCTQDTIASLPEDQYQALIEKAKERLEQLGHSGDTK